MAADELGTTTDLYRSRHPDVGSQFSDRIPTANGGLAVTDVHYGRSGAYVTGVEPDGSRVMYNVPGARPPPAMPENPTPSQRTEHAAQVQSHLHNTAAQAAQGGQRIPVPHSYAADGSGTLVMSRPGQPEVLMDPVTRQPVSYRGDTVTAHAGRSVPATSAGDTGFDIDAMRARLEVANRNGLPMTIAGSRTHDAALQLGYDARATDRASVAGAVGRLGGDDPAALYRPRAEQPRGAGTVRMNQQTGEVGGHVQVDQHGRASTGAPPPEPPAAPRPHPSGGGGIRAAFNGLAKGPLALAALATPIVLGVANGASASEIARDVGQAAVQSVPGGNIVETVAAGGSGSQVTQAYVDAGRMLAGAGMGARIGAALGAPLGPVGMGVGVLVGGAAGAGIAMIDTDAAISAGRSAFQQAATGVQAAGQALFGPAAQRPQDQFDVIYASLPAQSTPDMPPEMQALIENKNMITQAQERLDQVNRGVGVASADLPTRRRAAETTLDGAQGRYTDQYQEMSQNGGLNQVRAYLNEQQQPAAAPTTAPPAATTDQNIPMARTQQRQQSMSMGG